jgi:sialic acid synthase SpsE
VSEANLRAIPYLEERFSIPVGYSDHTLGILACQTAVALGACVIEKHFTYRKENQSFRDHALSADPAEMKKLVANIRLIEKSLGKYGKEVAECEKGNRVEMRRSLAICKGLAKGDLITEDAIILLRPATGIPPERLSSIVGRRVIRNIPAGTIIKEGDLE